LIHGKKSTKVSLKLQTFLLEKKKAIENDGFTCFGCGDGIYSGPGPSPARGARGRLRRYGHFFPIGCDRRTVVHSPLPWSKTKTPRLSGRFPFWLEWVGESRTNDYENYIMLERKLKNFVEKLNLVK